MELMPWQKAVMENEEDGLMIHEVMAVRGAGKTTFGLEWVTTDSDSAVVIVPNHQMAKRIFSNTLGGFYKDQRILIFTDLHQFRGRRFGENLKVFVDEYFMNEWGLDELDKALGDREDYRVLFAGTRRKPTDNYKINFSKHYLVDMAEVLFYTNMNPKTFVNTAKYMSDDQFDIEFGVPREQN